MKHLKKSCVCGNSHKGQEIKTTQYRNGMKEIHSWWICESCGKSYHLSKSKTERRNRRKNRHRPKKKNLYR